MIAIALASGFAVVGGVLLAVSALRPVPLAQVSALPSRERRELPSPERVGLVCLAALAVIVVTRWPVAAIAAGLAAWSASSPGLRQQKDPAAMAEALTGWAEMLRDATGTPRGIEGVLVATADGAPELIRPHVVRLARRLPYERLEDALDGLAADLDHPVGDLIVTALRLSAQSGGRQIRAVLDDLASVAREEARMHRRIDVARARPRADMRSVLVIMAVFVALFVVVGRNYLEPYRTLTGQLVLCVVIGVWGLAVRAMVRLGRSHPIDRFLADELMVVDQ